MNLGNVGDANTVVRLYCDLQAFGWTLIRKGWKRGLPQDKSPVWVFCPRLRSNFPRDRILISECQKCSHYKSISHSITEAMTLDVTRKGARTHSESLVKVKVPVLKIPQIMIEEVLKKGRGWRKEEKEREVDKND